MPPVGILAGMQDTGGAPFQEQEQAVTQTRQAQQEAVRTDIAQQGAQQSAQRFQLEQQFAPYKMKLAEQEVADNERKFQEADRIATNRTEAAKLAQELAENAHGMTLEEFTLKGMNISRLLGDAVGVHTALGGIRHLKLEDEQGKAASTLYETVKPNLAAIMNGTAPIETLVDTIGEVTKNPRGYLGFGKGLMQHLETSLKQQMPPDAFSAIQEFNAQVGNKVGADAANLWRQVQNKYSSTAGYFAKNPTSVPSIARRAEAVAEDTEKAKARAEAEFPKKKELEDIRGGYRKATATITAQGHVQGAQIAERGRVTAAGVTADAAIQGKEITAGGKAQKLTGLDEGRIADARKVLDNILADPALRLKYGKKTEFDKWLTNNVAQGRMSTQEKDAIIREYGRRFQ